ncbi:hypothetical protein ROG8370_03662 [Roseovarius gaetbuli]|uniref:Insertion element IS150 protein InsJ-like helix-turn-helix domain-containing protein n=1 Tax=Roseovarius gaetbuli TaxID=1356575 RepID=A0A1X7AAG8_9RHOB|nr:hypothetical protein ROG8370_03662 [Roseovarius gaetbuli]
MNKDQREIGRKLRILRYAEEIGHVAKTCRYFGIGRASFYRWRKAYAEHGEAGLINAPPIPKWHAIRTPPEREEKVLYLRRKYHLGPMRQSSGSSTCISLRAAAMAKPRPCSI